MKIPDEILRACDKQVGSSNVPKRGSLFPVGYVHKGRITIIKISFKKLTVIHCTFRHRMIHLRG
jgi:hypothetical protein